MIFQLDSVYVHQAGDHSMNTCWSMLRSLSLKFSFVRQTLPSSTAFVHKHFRTSNCTNSPAPPVFGTAGSASVKRSRKISTDDVFTCWMKKDFLNTFHSHNSSEYTFRLKTSLITKENRYFTRFLLLTANMLIQVHKEIYYLTWLRLGRRVCKVNLRRLIISFLRSSCCSFGFTA